MIQISTTGYVLIFAITTLAVLSHFKEGWLALLYQLSCALAAMVGVIGMFVSRQMLLSALADLEANSRSLTEGFVPWCVDAFDKYALVGMVITFFGLFFSFYLLKFKPSFIPVDLRQPGRITLMLQVLILVLSITYGLNTINKIFDVSSFISLFAISCIGLLCIVYVMERRAK